MNIQGPKFSIGEVVILQSKDLPKFNGQEFTIKEIFPPHSDIKSTCGKKIYRCAYYSYSLGFDIEWKGGLTNAWGETCLRKKHQPGEMSFDALMNTLKLGESPPMHNTR